MSPLEMPTAGWIVLAIVQAILMLMLAPLATGFSRVIRAKIHSRQGPGVLQDYRDIAKLLRRQSVAPANSGFIFWIMPWVLVVTMLLIGMALPTVTQVSPFPISGDIITDIYLLAIFRFFFALSGIDSNSMFAGMGSSRELTLGILVEPILILAIVVVALSVGTTDLGYISHALANNTWHHPLTIILAGIVCAFALFIEMGKVPFDSAEAEQELQEGPVTEYSGSALAMVKLGLGLKQLVVAQLFLAIFIPWGKASSLSFGGLFSATIILLIKLFVVFLIAGLVENTMARVRFTQIHRTIFPAFLVAVLALIFLIFGW
ncbi:hydrogenase 3 membrane subunit [Photobacterium phosphoreum]|jgi:hydrogenase-4 component C|uniref:Hydrogenase 3 membrane subunit n=1 Tax=Photobacterium phosphoreum TaxID=659 RepID=A0A2T3K2Y3_PHOPO|nr:respiratory chain complex I subunit 1 family protein [Photobacterium phosphoreum]KJF87468.1 hydrogenase 3 membrane subunit [Photobacterium phosphoreum]MCD9461984.1 hydrogenase 3 membrane subunit [Photobacterium phosphoreum]MCD9469455.1 hydrogenase 3 membrane subunit [Photobacterium phosphoreum]MCD9475191.1 hydrogenase 3 membrane subunit [Photobacterium phosphoreum]MCD9479009.1 hydrogenase 3 membrane subunit [Photobacterium phosphoreum]